MTTLEIGTDVNNLPSWFLNFLHLNDIFESAKSIDWENKLTTQLHKYHGTVMFEKHSIFVNYYDLKDVASCIVDSRHDCICHHLLHQAIISAGIVRGSSCPLNINCCIEIAIHYQTAIRAFV